MATHIRNTDSFFPPETVLMSTRLQLQRKYVSVLFGAKKFFSSRSVRTDSGTQKTSYIINTGGKAAQSCSRLTGIVKTDVNNDIAADVQDLRAKTSLNLLKPAGHVMHQQFNIQQLYVLPTLYLSVLYLSENKQRLVPLTA